MNRAKLPLLGYVYVALSLPALLLGTDHLSTDSALLTASTFAYIWYLASLSAQLVRFDPTGFFASVVGLGGAAYIPLQVLAVMYSNPRFAGPSAACAATVIVGSSAAAWRARKIPRWFGQAGSAGGIAVLVVGMVESAANWTFAGDAIFASSLGFLVWVLVTTSYLLRR